MAAGYQPVGGLSVDFFRWMGYRVSVKVLKCSRTIIIMDSVSWPECFRSESTGKESRCHAPQAGSYLDSRLDIHPGGGHHRVHPELPGTIGVTDQPFACNRMIC